MKLRAFVIMLFSIHSSYAQPLTLTIGITGNNPPFSSRIDEHNHFYGFDIDIMNAVCKQMKAECHYVGMRFDKLFPAIDTNHIDLAIDSIIITSERQKKYIFSQPYLTSRVQFMTNQSSAINSPDDLNNKRIGVRQSNQFKQIFNNLYQKKMTVIVYSHMPDLLLGLAENKVDAIIINDIAAQYWYANNNNQYKLIGKPIPLGQGFGIMAKFGRDALTQKVNQALQQMVSNGSYASIYNNYFG